MPVERSQLISFLRERSLFRDLEEEKLDLLIDRLETVTKEDGAVIFKQGDEAGALYLIFSGCVNLTRWAGNREDAYMTLVPGDLLGYEIFGRGETRKVNARASGTTLLLSLNYSSLVSVIKQIPVLYNRFKIRVDSFHLALHVKLSWRKPDEAIYYLSRRHQFFLARRFIGPFLFGFLALTIFSLLVLDNAVGLGKLLVPGVIIGLVFLGYCFWEYIDWTNDYAIITSRRVNFQEKIVLLYDSRREALLTAIRSVETFVDRTGLVVGFGNVIVHTFAGDIILERIGYVKDVTALLEEQRRRALSAMAKQDIQSFKNTIRQRIQEGVRQPVNLPQAEAPQRGKPKKPVYLRTRRSNFMNMRFEEGGNVTYRTHIFILFEKILFPVIFLIILTALLIAGLASGSSIMTNATGRTIWLSAAGILAIIVLVVTLYRAEDWRNDIYVITNDQLIDRNKKPLGREDVRTANLANIEAIRFEQRGLWALLFNFGTVFVRVGLQELPFMNIYNPSEVQRELFRRIAERENKRQLETLRVESERVADWIEAYYQVVSGNDQGQENPQKPETLGS